jgi:SulP family sulfate permease
MTLHGMTAALLAGLIVALSTFALQSMTNLDPIFRVISAATLRSSAWTRSAEASKILDDKIRGRSRILVVSLQGHLFFGNVADLTDSLKGTLRNLQRSDQSPFILLLDFTLVVGMDSSAAHAIAKLKDVIHRSYSVEVTIFVTGKHREGFPCAYALSEALTVEDTHETIDFNDVQVNSPKPARARRGSISVTPGSKAMKASQALRAFAKNHVFDDLDAALMLAEDFLVARERPSLLKRSTQDFLEHLDDEHLGEEEEKRLAVRCFENLVPDGKAFETQRAIELLLSKMTREEYAEGSILWKHGEDSDCAKLLVYGALIATVDGTDVREKVKQGTLLGELGLIEGFRRLTTVSCTSEKAIVYSISRREWDEIVKKKPEVARIIDRIAIRYLAQRVQHVSNRIFETRCLPV